MPDLDLQILDDTAPTDEKVERLLNEMRTEVNRKYSLYTLAGVATVQAIIDYLKNRKQPPESIGTTDDELKRLLVATEARQKYLEQSLTEIKQELENDLCRGISRPVVLWKHRQVFAHRQDWPLWDNIKYFSWILIKLPKELFADEMRHQYDLLYLWPNDDEENEIDLD